MMKTLLPAFLVLGNMLITLLAYAQPVYFSKEYHFRKGDGSRSVLETDSGYLVMADSREATTPLSTTFLFLNKEGNLIRTKEISKPLTNLYHGSQGSAVKVSGNNPGFAYAGSCEDTTTSIGYLVRLNTLGDTLWTKTFTNDIVSIFDQCKLTEDGGFVMCGVTGPPSDTMGDAGFWLVKTDSLGNKEWEKRYQDTIFQRAYSIGVCKDKGYILGGVIFGPNQPATTTLNIKVIKTDSTGKVEWEKQWGGDYSDGVRNIEQTQDGGYIVSGYYSDGEYDRELYLAKLNVDGDIEWDNSYGPIDNTMLKMVHELSDGSFIACGSNFDGLSASYIGVVLKVAADGEQIWYREHRLYEAFQSVNRLEDIKPTSDGGFIASGSVDNRPQVGEGQNIWVLKLDSLGCVAPGGCPNLYTGIEEVPVASGEDLVVYPNPARAELNIRFESPAYLAGTLEIYSLTGSQLMEVRLDDHTVQLNVSHLPAGTYFYHVKSSTELSKNGKLVISR